MAYLRTIAIDCQTQGCKSRAVVELLNRFNSVIGRFCRKCGTRRLKQLKADESK